jgi:hypothetical protein
MDAKGTASLICETTSHAIYLDGDGTDTVPTSTWVTLSDPSNGIYTITFDPAQDQTLIAGEASVTHTVYVKSTLDAYTSQVTYTSITLTITETGCDCSYLAWDTPAHLTPTIAVADTQTYTIPTATANTGATSSEVDFEKCYEDSTPCDENGAFQSVDVLYDGGVLPAWISFTSTGSTA